MKIVTLQVVSPKPEKITKEVYDKAKKLGDVECSYATAIQNVALAKGLYEIKPEPKSEVHVRGIKEPEDMTAQELINEAIFWGKKPTKKQPNRSDMIKMIRGLRQSAAASIVDDISEDPEQ